MTVFVRHDFTADANGTALGDAIPGLTAWPSSLLAQTVNGGTFTFAATTGFALKDVGIAVRRMRFVAALPMSVAIAAIDQGDGTGLVHILSLGLSSYAGASGTTVFYDTVTVDTATGAILNYTGGGTGFGSGFSQFAGIALTDSSIVAVDVATTASGQYSVQVNGTPISWSPVDGATPGQLPPALASATSFGLVAPQLTSHPTIYHAISANDGADITYIASVVPRRAGDDTKLFIINAFCNKAAVTGFSASVRVAATGAEIATGSATRTGATTSIETTPIGRDYTGVPLVIHLAASPADPDQQDDFFLVGPFIPTLRPYRLGWNASGFGYYGIGAPTRDLAHYMLTALDNGKQINMPWNTDRQIGDGVPGSDVGQQYNGWPTKWSTLYPDCGIVFAMANFLEPSGFGDYVIDRRAQLGWHLYTQVQPGQDASHRTITRNHFGEGLDLLHVVEHDHSTHVLVDDDNWQIYMIPPSHPASTTQPGGYLEPSTFATPGSEEYRITIRKVGDTSPKLYTPEHFAWWRTLGGIGQRYMTDQGVNLVPGDPELPLGFLTPEKRTRVDGNWGAPGCIGRAYEYQLQLTSDAKGWLWHNIPHYADETWAAWLVTTAMSQTPDLEVVFEGPGNENWNNGFLQGVFMGQEGWRRGLHKADAVPGQNEGLAIPTTLSAAQFTVPMASYAEGERRQYNGVIYVRVGAQDTSKLPYEDGSGWNTEGDFHTAQVRMIAEIAHGWIDAMKAACGDALWGTRYKFTVGTWQYQTDYIAGALDWPNADGVKLGARVHGVNAAMYFGGEQVQFDNPYQDAVAKHAAPGPARVTALLNAIAAERDKVLLQWSAFQTYIASLNAANGWDLEGMCYEGGLDSQVSGGSGSPEDIQARMVDLVAVYTDPRMRTIYRDWLVHAMEEAGGHICGFEAFNFPWHDHEPYDFLFWWGISSRTTDLTSARYLGVQDSMKDLDLFQDPSLDPPPPITLHRRRPPPQLLRLAA